MAAQAKSQASYKFHHKLSRLQLLLASRIEMAWRRRRRRLRCTWLWVKCIQLKPNKRNEVLFLLLVSFLASFLLFCTRFPNGERTKLTRLFAFAEANECIRFSFVFLVSISVLDFSVLRGEQSEQSDQNIFLFRFRSAERTTPMTISLCTSSKVTEFFFLSSASIRFPLSLSLRAVVACCYSCSLNFSYANTMKYTQTRTRIVMLAELWTCLNTLTAGI